MDKNIKYIDTKITVWRRYSYNNDKNLEEFLEEIKKNSFEDILEDSLDFMHETDENLMTIEENDNQCTLEIYNKKETLLWDNKNGKNTEIL